MSDHDQRILERAACQGDLRAEAAWHLDRARHVRSPLVCTDDLCRGNGGWVRLLDDDHEEEVACDRCAGTGLLPLDPDGFGLAGYCGHEASRLIAGIPCACGFVGTDHGATCCLDDEDRVPDWTFHLHRWGKAVCIHALVAAERLSWRSWSTKERGAGERSRILELIESAEDWVLDPCEETFERCREIGYGNGLWTGSAWHVGYGSMGPQFPPPNWHGLLVRQDHPFPWSGGMIEELCGGETNVRGAIRAELVPWVLGLRDPVAERRT